MSFLRRLKASAQHQNLRPHIKQLLGSLLAKKAEEQVVVMDQPMSIAE